jgi:hypothetical protein
MDRTHLYEIQTLRPFSSSAVSQLCLETSFVDAFHVKPQAAFLRYINSRVAINETNFMLYSAKKTCSIIS